MHRAPINPNGVSANTLVAMIQKGMLYTELEANAQVGTIIALCIWVWRPRCC